MGHSTATEIIKVEEIPAAQTTRSLYGPFNQSLEERILSAGVARWYDEEANRWDSANPGDAVMLKPVAGELVNDAIEHHFQTSKRGYYSSPVVPIIDEKDYEIKTKTVTIKLVGDEWNQYLKDRFYGGIITKKVAELLPDIANVITGMSVVTEKEPNQFRYNPSEGWTVRSSVKADTSGGKAVTVYRLLIDGNDWAKETYESQALARAAGTKIMENNLNIQSIEVIPKIVREDGTALVKLTRETKQATAKLKVHYVKMKTDKPTVTSYAVAFDYHH